MTAPSTTTTDRATWILARPQRLPEGVAHCHEQGGERWPEWEERLLRSIRRTSRASVLVPAGVRYAREIMKGRWPKLEVFLFMPSNLEHLVSYMTRDIVGTRWKEMEDAVLNGTCHPLIRSTLAVRYATQILGGRWRRAEPLLIQDSADLVLAHLFDRWMCPSEEGRMRGMSSPSNHGGGEPQIFYFPYSLRHPSLGLSDQGGADGAGHRLCLQGCDYSMDESLRYGHRGQRDGVR